jgi:hypothetical protein
MLRDRLIRATVRDEDGDAIADATVRFFLNDTLVGEITNLTLGRATFQVSPTDKVVSIEAEYKNVRQRVRLAADCDEWDFDLPVFQGVHLVLLVHGINTRAHWIAPMQRRLEAAGLKVSPAGYGFYGAIRFLIPIDWLRRQAVERVRIRYNAAVQVHNPKKVSVIAHSFGTYVVARLMKQEFGIKWHRIVFCGSVIPNKFPFEQIANRFKTPILNEVGTRDIWPALAETVTWGYGSIGSHGFQGEPLRERWHRGFTHSQFLEPDFASKYWIPFLSKGEVVDGDDPVPLPIWIRLLTALPLRWPLWILLAIATAYLVPRAFLFAVQLISRIHWTL